MNEDTSLYLLHRCFWLLNKGVCLTNIAQLESRKWTNKGLQWVNSTIGRSLRPRRRPILSPMVAEAVSMPSIWTLYTCAHRDVLRR
ncbi:hypothetical protein ATANTOWER_014937 [Ataeniobius toweri]|uniref:Uncharacterized protein n=1 Tax=Ataeniobius toweri TaxID=208326 RepID=A0ABU7B9G5_9TELE|nr:hypothetical protein [Ataeniobius toweri]